jgi:5-methylthioadenosine/S-adenosylhomocysteine deaminase
MRSMSNAKRYTPRWCIVPAEDGSARVIAKTEMAVVVDGTNIVYVGALADAPHVDVHIDLPMHVLMPGLVNAHVHSAMVLLRGIADDAPLDSWLTQAIWPREAAHVNPAFVYDGTLLAAHEMLCGGITCAGEAYFYLESAATAFSKAGMRAMLAAPVIDFPTRYAANTDEYLQKALAAHDALREVPRMRVSLGPHAPYTVSDESFAKIRMYADELGLPVQMHLQETAREVTDSKAQYGVTPTQRLAALGLLTPALTVAHGVHLSSADIALLAQAGASVVHCPTSNMKLASGIAPMAEICAAGINVALGTDGAASNNRLDMWQEMRHAGLLAKVATGNAAALPAAQILHMATLGGARALGWDDEIGSLAAGKAADMIAVRIDSPDQLPMYDVLSHLVYVCDRSHVTDVWVAGAHVVADQKSLTLNADLLRQSALAWQGILQ